MHAFLPPSVPASRKASPFADLVDASFDEAAFLWRRWENELSSLTRNLDEVWSWTEDRLHGALDGVRVVGDELTATVRERLASGDSDATSVCAALLAASSAQDAISVLTSALADAQDGRLRSLLRGLELAGAPAALSASARVLESRGAAHSAALCRLKAFHRASPGQEMRAAFDSNVPELQAEAMRAARYLRSQYVEEWIHAGIDGDDPVVRYAAVESGVARGVKAAWSAAVSHAGQLDANAAPYLKLVALFGTAEEHEIVYTALRLPALQRQAIWALAHIGTTRAAQACLSGMQHETLARAAGEAYCWITGADLERDQLAAGEPPTDAPAFEDEDLSADLVPTAEELWPPPALQAVRQHWRDLEPQLATDVRYVRGRPGSIDTLVTAVETGPMLRRPDLLLELAAKTHGAYDVEPCAFASRQRVMMAKGRAALSARGAR
ncbi:MAG: hypothetical protein ACREV5_11130 [Steroidobacter sp.]